MDNGKENGNYYLGLRFKGLGFPDIRGTFVGVPIIGTVEFGVYIGVPIFWETQCQQQASFWAFSPVTFFYRNESSGSW